MKPNTAAHQSVTTWLLGTVRPLVQAPESVSVDLAASDDALLLVVRVAEGDVGRLIGRDNRTLTALRTLAYSVGALRGLRVSIEIAGRRGRSHVPGDLA